MTFWAMNGSLCSQILGASWPCRSVTSKPVLGKLTAETPVPGCASGASQVVDIEMAVRFCLEVAKTFGRDECAFYDAVEFRRLVALYGSMKHLQTLGKMAGGAA